MWFACQEQRPAMPLFTRQSMLWISLIIASFVLAWQPAWAKTFIGYTGKTWTEDYGVLRGQCDAKAVAAALSAGVRFSAMAPAELNAPFQAIYNPPAPTLEAMAIDAYCVGHTLELVPAGQGVKWLNPISGTGVFVTPGPSSDKCRTVLGVTVVAGEKTKFRGEACSSSPGVWQFQ